MGLRYFPEWNGFVTWPALGATAAAYGVGLTLLYLLRRGRAPLPVRLPMLVYNAVQVLLCGWMTLGSE